MRTRKVNGIKLEKSHVIMGIYTSLGYAAFEVPSKVVEVYDDAEKSAFSGTVRRSYRVYPITAKGTNVMPALFIGHDDDYYRVMEIY